MAGAEEACLESRGRELALFNLGIDSKLRGCDLVVLRVRDVCHGDQVATRAIVMQHKTQRPVQFEITQAARDALQAWIKQAGLKPEDFLSPSRLHDSPHLGTRQHARILGHWVDELGLDRAEYGTHSMRRTKATLIYRRTKNLLAVQLLLGHSKTESTVRHLGIEVDAALESSEQTEIRSQSRRRARRATERRLYRACYTAANRRAPTRAGSVVARTASNAAWASG